MYWLFWGGVFLSIYPYVIYPLLLALAPGRTWSRGTAPLPKLSLILTVHNEGDRVGARLENILSQEYPAHLLEVLVLSDGSTDSTLEKAQAFPDARVLDLPRLGKSGALSQGVPQASGEILVFTDASTYYHPNTLGHLAQAFADPQVGGVGGELRFHQTSEHPSSIGAGEGSYWQYETFLRRQESRIGSAVVVPGTLYAIRRSLFSPPPRKIIADDFWISLQVLQQGYRFVYTPQALGSDPLTPHAPGEFRRKIRVIAGGIQTLWLQRNLLAPRWGQISWSLWSHKVLRWGVSLTLPVVLGASLLLARHPFYALAFWGQVALYTLAILGWIGGFSHPVLSLPRHFVSTHLAVYWACIGLITGHDFTQWERTDP